MNNASSYLCIGYGFNDDHLQPKLIEQIQRYNKPIVIVTKELSSKGQEILKNSQKHIVFEEDDNEKTKVTIDGEETIVDGNMWKLGKFAEMWLG